MNRDQVKGRVNDAAGYVQRKAAKLTGTTTQRAPAAFAARRPGTLSSSTAMSTGA